MTAGGVSNTWTKRSTRAATSRDPFNIFGPAEIDDQPLSRDDKRYTEKKNKTERARRKKEDIARLRNIVDVCLSADPRIKRIKQEEKEAREAKKRGKAGTPQNQQAKEEEKKKAEEEAKKKEEEEKVRRVMFHLFRRTSDDVLGCSRASEKRQNRGC